MFSLRISFLAFAAMAFAQLFGAAATPVSSAPLSNEAREVLARATPTAPHFVIYSDEWPSSDTLPSASTIKGYNVFLLAFWLVQQGPYDVAELWTELSASQRSQIKAEYKAAGITLAVSAFGSTDTPTTDGYDPVDLANRLSAFVKDYDLDGVDIDYEDFDAVNSGKSEAWLISFTKQLRVNLPQGQYILTHAPVAPWFSTSSLYQNGAYRAVHKAVGDLIDWYNVQFYNHEYTTCDGLLNTSSSQFPNSAVFQIATTAGVPLNKIVIGKPARTQDADNGYIALDTLATCLSQAKAKGWNGGAMVWEYPYADASWIKTVRSKSWPVS